MSQVPRNFEIEADSVGKTMVVTGPWSENAAQIVRSGEVDGLYLNYAKGFCEDNLDFFEVWPLRRLKIIDRKLRSLDPIARVANQLEEFSVEAAPEARADFIAMPQLRSLVGHWPNIRAVLNSATSLATLSIYDFDDTNFLSFVVQTSLESLTIKVARRLESLSGIGALRSLSFLGIHAAGKLDDLSELSESPPPLRELRLELCPRVSRIDTLGGLAHLQKTLDRRLQEDRDTRAAVEHASLRGPLCVG